MLNFECDYNNGCHPEVLQRLIQTNDQVSLTYGFDHWTDQAKIKIRQACHDPEADIYFLTGGTQANATVIDGMLCAYEGVVCADTAHINVHEAGAIEASGHRVIALPSHDGRLLAADLDAFMRAFDADESRDHLAQPGMVYITMPTELGTIYTRSEIEALHRVCQEHELPLYVDGARLGYGLMADGCDFDLPWLCTHCDAFYIGGTKVGALCGEAVVFPRHGAPRKFFTIVKRHGALMAKGRLVGLQFDALFTSDEAGEPLYFRISRHAIQAAARLRRIFTAAGLQFFIDSPTNQQFVVVPNTLMHRLEDKVIFTHWQAYDAQSTVCRFVTSWATTDAQLDTLEQLLAQAREA